MRFSRRRWFSHGRGARSGCSAIDNHHRQRSWDRVERDRGRPRARALHSSPPTSSPLSLPHPHQTTPNGLKRSHPPPPPPGPSTRLFLTYLKSLHTGYYVDAHAPAPYTHAHRLAFTAAGPAGECPAHNTAAMTLSNSTWSTQACSTRSRGHGQRRGCSAIGGPRG